MHGLIEAGRQRRENRMRIRSWAKIGATVLVAAAAASLGAAAAGAEPPEVSARRAAERKVFSDAEIAEGFFKVVFGAELHFRGAVDRVRKFTGPVRVFIDNRTKLDRRAEVERIIADIGARIAHLDIAVTRDRSAAQVLVTLVRDRDLARTIYRQFGRQRARQILRSLEPQCLSGFRKDADFRILHSNVILAVDVGDDIFYDCAYEEILQALGPINDDASVPWTMFNDDVQMGFFGVYDQYLLNILYHPRIRPGMTRQDVRALLPELLPGVRAWVARVNRLPP
jgi:hypothetical protein